MGELLNDIPESERNKKYVRRLVVDEAGRRIREMEREYDVERNKAKYDGLEGVRVI